MLHKKTITDHPQNRAELYLTAADKMQDAWLQASAANYMKSALFCDVMRRVVVIRHRSFVTT